MPEPAAIRRARPVTGGEWEIRHVASIDSTNRLLLDEARAGAPDGVVVVADHQTAGRGRRGRTWEAAPGSALLVSVLLRPSVPPERLARCTLAGALALADAVAAATHGGVAAGLKWPNDLVVGDRKLAGLLAEADLVGAAVRAVVVGAGCNLTEDAFPPDLATTATSVAAEAGCAIDREDVLAAFLDALDVRLGDPDGVIAAARERSATLGRRVQVDLGGGRALAGTADNLTDTGALVVRDDAGRSHRVAVGDVVHLRPLP
jgi:BirA family biotin operon repressor/biotin-[acetyl-CoA-carboxylase] ligase